jgi:carbamate kinase
MRIVVAIDGDLLVPQNPNSGIAGQIQEIIRVVDGLGELFHSGHEIVVTHGNAPQIGYMLLRAELASHVVHTLPLDVCGSDTQGATGYLLQREIRNWLQQQHDVTREVATVVTQVLVDVADPAFDHPTRGIGPYYDQDKARLYTATRQWSFALVPGRGYRRSVPSLKPKHVIEAGTIMSLLTTGTLVICAGGGGIPVYRDERGSLIGADAVIDKAHTTSLLATEISAGTIVFVSLWDEVELILQMDLSRRRQVSGAELDQLMERTRDLDEDLYNKLAASQAFLAHGGRSVLIVPPGRVSLEPECCRGLFITRD